MIVIYLKSVSLCYTESESSLLDDVIYVKSDSLCYTASESSLLEV